MGKLWYYLGPSGEDSWHPNLSEFPPGEPESEAPQTGWCATCGAAVSWPNDFTPWPTSCPNGCSPFHVTNEDPH